MSLNRLELKSTSAFRLRALRPWQQTRIHCQEQPETKSGEVISMCVVRPETASPQLLLVRGIMILTTAGLGPLLFVEFVLSSTTKIQ